MLGSEGLGPMRPLDQRRVRQLLLRSLLVVVVRLEQPDLGVVDAVVHL